MVFQNFGNMIKSFSQYGCCMYIHVLLYVWLFSNYANRIVSNFFVNAYLELVYSTDLLLHDMCIAVELQSQIACQSIVQRQR